MSDIDNHVWPPPPQAPDAIGPPKDVKCWLSVTVLSWLPALLSAGGCVEFWRLDWFDGDAGKVCLSQDSLSLLPVAVAVMVLGGYLGYQKRDRWVGKLAVAVPVASAAAILPYVFYFYRWKDL